jgi:hypothetical protein
MKIGRGKPKYLEKTCPSATLSTTNPTWLDPVLNPDRRGGKPATNHFELSRGPNPQLNRTLFVWSEQNKQKCEFFYCLRTFFLLIILFFTLHVSTSAGHLQVFYIYHTIAALCVHSLFLSQAATSMYIYSLPCNTV